MLCYKKNIITSIVSGCRMYDVTKGYWINMYVIHPISSLRFLPLFRSCYHKMILKENTRRRKSGPLFSFNHSWLVGKLRPFPHWNIRSMTSSLLTHLRKLLIKSSLELLVLYIIWDFFEFVFIFQKPLYTSENLSFIMI